MTFSNGKLPLPNVPYMIAGTTVFPLSQVQRSADLESDES